MPRYLTEADVARLASPALAYAAVEASFHRLARGEIDNPLRTRLPIPDGVFAVMPCVDRGLGLAGLKTFTWTPGGTPFLVVLMSIENAQIEAVLEADTLGRLRTAAASAVAATHFARPGATSLGVFGSGHQSAAHVAALREALPGLERVVVHGRTPERVAAFCAEHGCEVAASAAEAAGCDVVVTATTATAPVLLGEWLADGAFVCAVGANEPQLRELDDRVLERAARIVVDSRAQAKAEAGDLIDPAARGVVDWEDVAELQDVVAGTVAGRQRADEIAVFKSSGLAAWDLALAAAVVGLPER